MNNRKEKILLIESDALTTYYITVMLKRMGFKNIYSVFSGIEAIITAEEKNPDFIIVETVLNGELDGIETIKNINTKHNIPHIYLTECSDPKTIRRIKDTNPKGIYCTPIDTQSLYTIIDKIIKVP